MYIPNYKQNRIIDKTYRPSNVLPRADKTYSANLKNPEIRFPASYNEKR